MALLNNDVDTFNNLVFENRNRKYGAYAIRVSYNQTLIKSTLIVSASFLLIVICLSYFSSTNIINDNNFFTAPNTIILGSKNFSIVEAVLQKQKEKQKPANSASKSASNVFVKNNADTTNSMKQNELLNLTTGNSKNINAIGTNNKDTASIISVTSTTVTLLDVPKPKGPVLWAEVMPKFNGNISDFIQRNIIFPESALSIGLSGTVYVSFVIDEAGVVSNVRAVKGIGYGCDEEAERVVRKMPKWLPGKMGKENVKVMMNLPIKYKSN